MGCFLVRQGSSKEKIKELFGIILFLQYYGQFGVREIEESFFFFDKKLKLYKIRKEIQGKVDE